MTLLKTSLFCAALFATSCASASVLYAAGYGNTGVYTQSTSTGVATKIAGSGDLDNGLGYDSAAGVMYGLNNANKLFTVNMTTGALTYLSNASASITELEYNPVDGLMYTLKSNGGLATVNMATGVVTNVGNSTFPQFTVTLAINGQGQAYAASVTNRSLYSVSLQTGAISLISSTAFGPEQGMTAIAFDETGTLYGNGTFNDSLGTINTSTGAYTVIGSNGLDYDIRALEFATDKRGAAVPLPGTLSLLGIGFLAFGAMRRKYRA
jgi:hypothetical protein